MQTPIQIHSLPVSLTGKEAIAIVSIVALETVIMTAIYKNYGIEFSGETTEGGKLKGSLKFSHSEKKCSD